MVQKSLTTPSVQELLRRSETARRRLGYDIAAFKRKLDVPARMKESLQKHPTGWVGGSVVAGLLTSFLLRGRKPKPLKEEKVRRAGLAGLALTAGGALMRPLVKSVVTSYLRKKLSSNLADRSREF